MTADSPGLQNKSTKTEWAHNNVVCDDFFSFHFQYFENRIDPSPLPRFHCRVVVDALCER
jgi:hypothetical protein